MSDLVPYDEARREARNALKLKSGRSLFAAAKMAGALALLVIPVAAMIASAVPSLIWPLVAICLAVPALSLLGGFFSFELQRLGQAKEALSEVLGSDRVYEVLLADARDERDRAKQEVTQLEDRLRAFEIRLHEVHATYRQILDVKQLGETKLGEFNDDET